MDVIVFLALAALVVAGAFVWPRARRYLSGALDQLLWLLALAVVLSSQVVPALAQESTPVPLDIPVDVLMGETNNWLATFAPIAAIGIGIAIALAVLGYLGKMVVGAFKG